VINPQATRGVIRGDIHPYVFLHNTLVAFGIKVRHFKELFVGGPFAHIYSYKLF